MIRILIMEDDLVDRMAINRVISKNLPDAQITNCSNVKETKEFLEKNKYDWVLSDFNLPDGTVFDILPYSNRIKMICLSGATAEAKIADLKKGGLYQFFIKDQQLHYLNKIIGEITQYIAEHSKKRFNSIFENLSANFGQNKTDWLEIIDMLLSKTISEDFNGLQSAINSEDREKTKFFSHKMQSSFRVLNKPDILQKLQNIEAECLSQLTNWIAIQGDISLLSKLILQTKSELLESKVNLINQLKN